MGLTFFWPVEMDITSRGHQSWLVTRVCGLKENSVASVCSIWKYRKLFFVQKTLNCHLRNEPLAMAFMTTCKYTICLHVKIVLLILIIASCPVIASIKNGIITHATLRDGGEVEIKCRPGYTLVGPSKLRCIEGKWHDSLPLCTGLQENDFAVMNSS